MSFLTALALAVAALVVAPYLAHRLRRKQAEEHAFAPTRLVPETPPKARRRARLEDRSLFAIRAIQIVALALLGASPLVKCSRLSLSRSGASVAVAIVLDDSMSMRVVDASGRSRWDRAKEGAREILGSLREGDAAAIVLGGNPARVALAATNDVSAAGAALEGMTESDRATDLDGAIAIAKTLIEGLPQIDRRIIVLSDRADGRSDAPPLGEGSSLPVWVALPDLAIPAGDCGILSSERAAGRARVRFACSTREAAKGREVRVLEGDKVIATAALPEAQSGEASLPVTVDEGKELISELTGKDAILSDDRAPVVVESGPAALAVVSDVMEEAVATGGAPVLEQALAALHVDMAVRPIPQAPDRVEDTTPFAAIAIDDPPGFTPEQRRALSTFVDHGGVLLLALGQRAASAPLGATFEPMLSRAVGFGASPAPGAQAAGASTLFGETVGSLADLTPKGRAKLAEEDVAAYETLARWTDGAPLFAHRSRGRGEVWLSTLPFSVEASDLPLRPGFLALLDAFVQEAKRRAIPRRSDVGLPWTFVGANEVVIDGPKGPLKATREDGVLRAVPSLIGEYRVTVDGKKELRVAAPSPREIDLRPRAVAVSSTASSLGGSVALVDMSWAVALGLLALVGAEIVARAAQKPRPEVA